MCETDLQINNGHEGTKILLIHNTLNSLMVASCCSRLSHSSLPPLWPPLD